MKISLVTVSVMLNLFFSTGLFLVRDGKLILTPNLDSVLASK